MLHFARPRGYGHFVSGAARSGFQFRGLVLERRDGFGHRSCLQERYLVERTVSPLFDPGADCIARLFHAFPLTRRCS